MLLRTHIGEGSTHTYFDAISDGLQHGRWISMCKRPGDTDERTVCWGILHVRIEPLGSVSRPARFFGICPGLLSSDWYNFLWVQRCGQQRALGHRQRRCCGPSECRRWSYRSRVCVGRLAGSNRLRSERGEGTYLRHSVGASNLVVRFVALHPREHRHQ